MPVKERANSYGVAIELKELGTIEHFLYEKQTKKEDEIWEIAKKHNCIGTTVKENSLVYLFFLTIEQEEFYNSIKQLIKCSKWKEPIELERNMPQSKATA